MQVIVTRDPLGGHLFKNRITGRTASVDQCNGMYYIYQDAAQPTEYNCKCICATNNPRRTFDVLERVLK